MTRYWCINQKLADWFHFREGNVMESPLLENITKSFPCLFRVVPSWLHTYPLGLKGKRQHWISPLLNKCRPILKLGFWSGKKIYPLIDKIIWSVLLISLSNTVNHGSKLCLDVIFSCYCPSYNKKKEKISNPCHSPLAVTDKEGGEREVGNFN